MPLDLERNHNATLVMCVRHRPSELLAHSNLSVQVGPRPKNFAQLTFSASLRQRRNLVVAMLRLEQSAEKVQWLNLFALPARTVRPLLMSIHAWRTTDVQRAAKQQFHATTEKYAKPLAASLSVKPVTIAQLPMARKSLVKQGHTVHLEARNRLIVPLVPSVRPTVPVMCDAVLATIARLGAQLDLLVPAATIA